MRIKKKDMVKIRTKSCRIYGKFNLKSEFDMPTPSPEKFLEQANKVPTNKSVEQIKSI